MNKIPLKTIIENTNQGKISREKYFDMIIDTMYNMPINALSHRINGQPLMIDNLEKLFSYISWPPIETYDTLEMVDPSTFADFTFANLLSDISGINRLDTYDYHNSDYFSCLNFYSTEDFFHNDSFFGALECLGQLLADISKHNFTHLAGLGRMNITLNEQMERIKEDINLFIIQDRFLNLNYFWLMDKFEQMAKNGLYQKAKKDSSEGKVCSPPFLPLVEYSINQINEDLPLEYDINEVEYSINEDLPPEYSINENSRIKDVILTAQHCFATNSDSDLGGLKVLGCRLLINTLILPFTDILATRQEREEGVKTQCSHYFET